LAAKKIRNCK